MSSANNSLYCNFCAATIGTDIEGKVYYTLSPQVISTHFTEQTNPKRQWHSTMLCCSGCMKSMIIHKHTTRREYCEDLSPKEIFLNKAFKSNPCQ